MISWVFSNLNENKQTYIQTNKQRRNKQLNKQTKSTKQKTPAGHGRLEWLKATRLFWACLCHGQIVVSGRDTGGTSTLKQDEWGATTPSSGKQNHLLLPRDHCLLGKRGTVSCTEGYTTMCGCVGWTECCSGDPQHGMMSQYGCTAHVSSHNKAGAKGWRIKPTKCLLNRTIDL